MVSIPRYIMVELLEQQRLSLRAAAGEIGVAPTTLYRRAKDEGIQLRQPGRGDRVDLATIERVVELHEFGLNQTEIALQVWGRSDRQPHVSQILGRRGMSRNKRG